MPKPRPEASVHNIRSVAFVHDESINKDVPFHSSQHASHHSMSSRAPAGIACWLSMFCNSVAASNRRRTKVRPGGITFAAKVRRPARDKSSRREQDDLSIHVASSALISVSLASGRRSSWRDVSNSIPKKVRTVVGGQILSQCS